MFIFGIHHGSKSSQHLGEDAVSEVPKMIGYAASCSLHQMQAKANVSNDGHLKCWSRLDQMRCHGHGTDDADSMHWLLEKTLVHSSGLGRVNH